MFASDIEETSSSAGFFSCRNGDFEFHVISSMWSSFHADDRAMFINNGR